MGALRDDEIGSITRSFQQTMEKLRFFDEQKRDRIVQDAAKLSLILDELSEPAAIVTTQYWVDAANQPFRALFGLTSDESEIPLPALLEEGSSVLEQRLLHAVQSRTTVTGSGLQLTDVDGNEQTYEAYVRPCIDTEGRLTHLLLILRRA
jgi:PAS domain-containing protein